MINLHYSLNYGTNIIILKKIIIKSMIYVNHLFKSNKIFMLIQLLEILKKFVNNMNHKNGWENSLKNLSDYTKDPTTNALDLQKTNASLTACFDKTFWNSFGIQMLFYSLHSLFQSYRAWNLINSFHIPSYTNQINRTREKLDECTTICSPLIDLLILTEEQIRRLQRVQELLRDIKDAIQFIIDDLKNKILQGEKYRSNNYFSALMNFFFYASQCNVMGKN